MSDDIDRLIAFRNAVENDLRAFLPNLIEVSSHFGPFDLDELRAFVLRAPAVRISIVGSAPGDLVSTREVDLKLHVAAYIVTRATATVPADVAALSIGEQLVGRLAKRPFTKWTEVPERIALENHYSGKLRDMSGGVALFSVHWHQVVRIGANVAATRVAGDGATNLSELTFIVNDGEPQQFEPGGADP